MTESRLPVYRAFLTPFDHAVITKNTHDSYMYGFTSIEDAILAAADPLGSEFSVNNREGVKIITELTSGDRDAARGFNKLKTPLYIYCYPPAADNELQPDGSIKVNKQTVGTLVLNLTNPLAHLMSNSYNIVFRSFENAAQKMSATSHRETVPSARMPSSWNGFSDWWFF